MIPSARRGEVAYPRASGWDKKENVFTFSGKKDCQIDNSNLYSNIDTFETMIDGNRVVNSQAMGPGAI
jgi:hypothetical protein